MPKKVSDSDRVIIGWDPNRNKSGEVVTFFLHYKNDPVVYAKQEDLQEKIIDLINRIDKDRNRI